MFEHRALRIFGPKRDEVTGEWRKLNIVELNDMYWSLNIIWVKYSRRMIWEGHVVCTGERHTGFSYRNLRERAHMEDLVIEGNLILRRIFAKRTGSSWLIIGTDVGYL